MKKIITVCLVLMMLITAAAETAVNTGNWAEGLSPQKPYTGSPEVDFNENIGYMLLMPVNESNILPGKNILQIYMPRNDVEIGSGLVSLYSEEDGLVEEIWTDSGKITGRDMTAEELEALIWGEGFVFEIAIEKPLEANRNYYVQMTEDVIVAPLYDNGTPAIENNTAWKFTTNHADYVDTIIFSREAEGETAVIAEEQLCTGDSAQVSIVIGEENVSAAIYCKNGLIVPDTTYMVESGIINIDFPANGEINWGVVFMDAEGNTIYSMDYITVVNAIVEAE